MVVGALGRAVILEAGTGRTVGVQAVAVLIANATRSPALLCIGRGHRPAQVSALLSPIFGRVGSLCCHGDVEELMGWNSLQGGGGMAAAAAASGYPKQKGEHLGRTGSQPNPAQRDFRLRCPENRKESCC